MFIYVYLFVCLLVCLLEEQAHRVDEQVGQKQGNPINAARPSGALKHVRMYVYTCIRKLRVCVYIYVCICIRRNGSALQSDARLCGLCIAVRSLIFALRLVS